MENYQVLETVEGEDTAKRAFLGWVETYNDNTMQDTEPDGIAFLKEQGLDVRMNVRANDSLRADDDLGGGDFYELACIKDDYDVETDIFSSTWEIRSNW